LRDISDAISQLTSILSSQYGINDAVVTPIESGRVHWTYLVNVNGRNSYVLQKLNPYFGSSDALGANLNRVNIALEKTSVRSPKIIPTLSKQWLYTDPHNDFYRLTSFLPGRPPEKCSLQDAGLAAKAVGRCHMALNRPKPIELFSFPDADGECTNHRLCVEGDFTIIKDQYRRHPNLPKIIDDVDRGAKATTLLPTKPAFVHIFLIRDLVVHRDCKRDNFLIDGDTVGLMDWDTVAYGDPLLDLGEMCRSWAISPTKPFFNASVASALLAGYRGSGLKLTTDQYRMLPAVVRGLALNLARRYLTDALAEVFFRWDKEAYPSLFEQNHIRGCWYLDLAEELLEREIELMKL
jgi:Ser/Thr protein kinase RdoA (MazF antagonist)